MKKTVAILSCIACIIACKDKKNNDEATTAQVLEKEQPSTKTKTITIHLEPKGDSKSSGTITFSEKEGWVTLSFEGKGFTPGEHGIHIHEKADCSSPDGKSTGGHWNPTFEDHGKWGTRPYHKGDIGNFIADENGEASMTFKTDEWCLGCEDETKNILGKAIIIHEGVDDFVSQPAGDAGSRINCGAIIE